MLLSVIITANQRLATRKAAAVSKVRSTNPFIRFLVLNAIILLIETLWEATRSYDPPEKR